MAYDATKDVEVASWKVEGDKTDLMISVYQYGDGEPKIQIGPRVYQKKNGDMSYTKAGRLTVEETSAILPFLTEALLKAKEIAGKE